MAATVQEDQHQTAQEPHDDIGGYHDSGLGTFPQSFAKGGTWDENQNVLSSAADRCGGTDAACSAAPLYHMWAALSRYRRKAVLSSINGGCGKRRRGGEAMARDGNAATCLQDGPGVPERGILCRSGRHGKIRGLGSGIALPITGP